jgi:hypothetical protein
MSIDKLIADLDAEGWRIWHLGQRTDGWTCSLYTERPHPAIVDVEQRRLGGYRGGFSRPGAGAAAEAAILDAAKNILEAHEDAIDIDYLLS